MNKELMKKLSGAGMGELDNVDNLPLLKVLNALSPEISGSDPTKTIEGAKAGDILFAKTQEILKQPIQILVLSTTTLYAEWRPKSMGGGLQRHHNATILTHPDYRKGNERSQYVEFIGQHDLVKTMYFMTLFEHNGEWEKGILAFTSTGLKAGRALTSLMNKFQYPEGTDMEPFIFSRRYVLSSVRQSNPENTWFTWKIEAGKTVDLTKESKLLELCLANREEAIASLPVASQATPSAPQLDDSNRPF